VSEYDDWHAAWGETIAKEPNRPCMCGGTISRHRFWCAGMPPHGYDENGEPYKESQLLKLSRDLGRKAAERVNEAAMRAITGC